MSAWQPRFRKALDEVFDEQSLTLLVSDYFAPKSFPKIAPPGAGSFGYRLHLLLEDARMDGWLYELVAAARERRPRSDKIAAIAEELGLTTTGPRLSTILPAQNLEAVVQQNAKFINPAKFLEGLARIEGQVCWVDVPGGGGTGFLVGPDVVLTNDHVIKPVREGRTRWQDVRCQFDYRQAGDGTVLKRRTIVELRQQPLLFRSPPSQSDWSPTVQEALPDEVDCALIQLSEAVGSVPVGGDTVDSKAEPRGWIQPEEQVPAVSAGNQVFLVSHPQGEPLQLSIGTVTNFNAGGTRVRYDANSKNGSSGSPVFNADLELVALHHARDLGKPPAWNQGIPFGQIRKVWKQNNISI
jgi:hypothetical protein